MERKNTTAGTGDKAEETSQQENKKKEMKNKRKKKKKEREDSAGHLTFGKEKIHKEITGTH